MEHNTKGAQKMDCRSCGAPLVRTFLNLGSMPLANSYLASPEDPDPRYPLHARICDTCLLVQADHVISPESIFSDYAFYSSYSAPWIDHAAAYATKMTSRFDLDRDSWVVEIASNDGCLLKQFRGPHVLGVDPAANIALQACADGIDTLVGFFGQDFASIVPKADLLVANNVLGHVPDLNDFVAGLASVLKPDGVLTIEFPWLLSLIRDCQYDTIYHEHFSYFSLFSAEYVLGSHGLRVFDVEPLDVHGGSLRLYVCNNDAYHPTMRSVWATRVVESDFGLDNVKSEAYAGFSRRACASTWELVEFLTGRDGQTVAGIGAPAKGNTLLNAAKVSPEDVAFTTDTNPHKQGMYLPGSHIPVLAPEVIRDVKPDFLLILAWNWAEAIKTKHAYIRDWGGKFVVPVPSLKVGD